MKLRSVVGSVLAGTGVLAAANRLLAWRAGDLEAPLDGREATYRWRGFDVAYTEAGDPVDPDLVLLHGLNAAGSSFEFRHVSDALADDYHVVAPDLPGFGRSDRPPIQYTADHYTTFVGDFLRDVADDPTVVASSHSGAYAAESVADGAPAAELVLISPTATSFPGKRPLVRSLVRTPLLGTALFNLATSKRAIRYFNADHGYDDTDVVTDDVVDYHWQTTHQPGARFAAASFFGGFLDVDTDLGATLADLDVPVTLAWGREATISPLEDGRELAEAADAQLEVFDDSDVQPHVERPDAFLERAMHSTGAAEQTDGEDGPERVDEEPGS